MKKLLFIFFIFTTFLILSQKPALAASPQPSDSLSIDFNSVSPNNTIFNSLNISPGFTSTKDIVLKNSGKNAITVYVKGARSGPSGQSDPKLETTIDFQILQGTTSLYSQKLSKFFTDSTTVSGVKLINLSPNQTQTISFKSSLATSTGNDFQGKSVVFNINFSDTSQSSNQTSSIVTIIINLLQKLFKLF